jgi:pantoate--beta-alanine ligase
MTDASALPVARSVPGLRAHLRAWREGGASVALVPTMGALHEGHLTLIRMARREADKVVASVFVNPRQFGPREDFAAYPRDEVRDAELLAAERCDLMYAPTVEEMYPPGFATAVTVAGVSDSLCGAARPGHFDGVATVVTKLLTQAAPDVAVFGEKDYQQLLVIRRVVRDLDLKVEILGAPTARDADGLALSSRNAYLTPEERRIAPRLNAVLRETAAAVAAGAPVEALEDRARAGLQAAGFERVDYLEVRGADDLARRGPGPAQGPSRVFAAAWLGRTRLIDNVPAA